MEQITWCLSLSCVPPCALLLRYAPAVVAAVGAINRLNQLRCSILTSRQAGKVGVNKKIFTFILMHADIHQYNQQQSENDQAICQILAGQIDHILAEAESKIWHGHPVWFLDGNPIVGYSKLKGSVRLLFWSGQSFGEEALINEGKFKAAEFRITDAGQIDLNDLHRWLQKSRDIQWDYKNIVKRKGQLERLK